MALSVMVLTMFFLIPMDIVEYLLEQLSELGRRVLRFHSCSCGSEFPLVGSKRQKVLVVNALWPLAIHRGAQLEVDKVTPVGDAK
jgi:hypothetical protein